MAIAQVILTCLTGYIGIRTCADDQPGSGLYINDLPGISNEVLQMVTDYESETYLQTWKEIEERTILQYRTRLMAKLNECYQINQMDTVECIACENQELLALSLWYLFGYQIMVQALLNWNNTRFTTVDRVNVEEIRDYYFAEFERELTFAVQGIDVEDSDCVNNEKECLQQNGKVHFRWSVM